MGIILATTRKEIGKVKLIGSTLSLLTLLVGISKALTERIANEKSLSIEEAERFIVECINEGIKTVK